MKRRISLLLAAVAFVALPIWAAAEASRVSELIREERGLVCGMPILAIYLLGLVGSAVFSAASLTLGVLAYRGLPVPRPALRKLELAIVGLPLFVACGVFLLLTISGA